MSLVKRAYSRRDDDDESADDVKPAPKIPAVADTTEKSNAKKRLGSSTAESAAKLLKLADSTSNDTRHAIDIANQLLHRDQESQTTKQEPIASSGPRSLLDLLPSPKGMPSSSSPKITPKSGENDVKDAEGESIEADTISQDAAAISSRSLTVKAMKKKNLSPDVNFDESMLKVTTEEGSSETSAQATPVRIVGPVIPAFLKGMKNSESLRVPEEMTLVQPDRNVGQPETFAPFASGPSIGSSGYGTPHFEHFAAQHYDPSFGIPGSGTVVDINVHDLVAAPSAAAPLPAHTRANVSGISRTARSKNQITYLAAVAPETERKMTEKKAELAKANKFGRY